MNVQDKLKTVETLTEDILFSLFKREYIVVRVPKFYHPQHCAAVAEKVLSDIDANAGSGIYESNIDSFWSAHEDHERSRRYFEHGIVLQRRLRQASAPFPSPIDLLRLTLDESWPGGAGLMRQSGMKAPFGISRLWREGSEGLPHQDSLNREVGADGGAIRLDDQIGVNIFLTTSDKGGEVETWDLVIGDNEYEKISDRFKGSYGYTREMLPKESVVITPEVGDLIMINTACVHAIRKITAGARLTISGFVGNAGADQPLVCWS
ncbi:MAG: 2OG-Fe(II) oxygenase [Pseudomonadota bacterium]